MFYTLTEIYERLYRVSDILHEQGDPLSQGFDRCLFLLVRAIKNSESINLHLEIKRLRKELKKAELKFDDWIEDKNVVYRKNKQLMEENTLLKANLKAYKK